MQLRFECNFYHNFHCQDSLGSDKAAAGANSIAPTSPKRQAKLELELGDESNRRRRQKINRATFSNRRQLKWSKTAKFLKFIQIHPVIPYPYMEYIGCFGAEAFFPRSKKPIKRVFSDFRFCTYFLLPFYIFVPTPLFSHCGGSFLVMKEVFFHF